MEEQAWQGKATVREFEIQLPHIRLNGRLWGNAGKPLILALHGWLDNADSYAPLAEYLSDYQLLAIDWPGHGLSEHRPGSYPLHWIDYLFDLENLMEALKQVQSPIALMGHSLGGIVASAYTASFAHRVPKLILLEAITPLFECPSMATKRLNKSFAGHLSWLANREKKKPVYDASEQAVKARSRLTKLDSRWCRLIVERNMQAVDGGVSWRSDPRLKLDSPMRLTFEQVEGVMQSVETQTLLITAEDGLTLLHKEVPKAKSWFSRLEHKVLDGDHHLHMGNSEAVAREVKQFLSTES